MFPGKNKTQHTEKKMRKFFARVVRSFATGFALHLNNKSGFALDIREFIGQYLTKKQNTNLGIWSFSDLVTKMHHKCSPKLCASKWYMCNVSTPACACLHVRNALSSEFQIQLELNQLEEYGDEPTAHFWTLAFKLTTLTWFLFPFGFRWYRMVGRLARSHVAVSAFRQDGGTGGPPKETFRSEFQCKQFVTLQQLFTHAKTKVFSSFTTPLWLQTNSSNLVNGV